MKCSNTILYNDWLSRAVVILNPASSTYCPMAERALIKKAFLVLPKAHEVNLVDRLDEVLLKPGISLFPFNFFVQRKLETSQNSEEWEILL